MSKHYLNLSYGLFLLGVFCSLVGCAGIPLVPGNEYSYKTKLESVKVTISHNPTTQFAPLIAAALPTFVDLATKAVKETLDAEAAKYTQSFVGFGADDHFFDSTVPDAGCNISSISVVRYAKTGGAVKKAFDLELKIYRSADKSAFRLGVDSIAILYSKAKVPFYQNTVDANANITISAFWVDDKGAANSKTVATLQIPLRGIKLGKDASANQAAVDGIFSDWFTVPRTIITAPVAAVSEQPATANKPEVKAKPAVEGKYGFGNFSVTANVTEVDDFGTRISTLSTDLSGDLSNLNAAIVKALSK